MTAYSEDELIRLALVEVKMQNQFFGPSPEQQTRLNDARMQWRCSRMEIISKTPVCWSSKRITLNQDISLETGWYRLPADFIAFENPAVIIDTDKDEHGITIYQLPSPTIRYFADMRTEDLDPLFQGAVRYRFLSKLTTSEDSAAIMANVILAKEAAAYKEWASSVAIRRDRIRRGLSRVTSAICSRATGPGSV